MDITIPQVIRGQVLKQGVGYLVRGQYVIGTDRSGWFWYDIYDRNNGGSQLADVQAAVDHLAAFITEATT